MDWGKWQKKLCRSYILVGDDIYFGVQDRSQVSNQQDAGFKLYTASFLRPAGGLLGLHFSPEEGDSKFLRKLVSSYRNIRR
jgi:hypothetical protein